MSCFDADTEAGAEILNNIVRMLPGVPEAEAREYMAQAMRKFARTSKLWTFKDFELTVCAGDQVVEIPADDGIEIQSVDKVLVADNSGGDDCWLELEEGDETNCSASVVFDSAQAAAAPGGGCSGCGDDPAVADRRNQVWQETTHQRGQVRFGRPFKSGQRLRFHLTLVPSVGSDAFPQHLIDDHQDAIQAGALSFGYMIPKQDWSDGQTGLFYRAIWERALAEAQAELKEREEKADLLARLDMKPGRPAYCGHGYQRGHPGRYRGYTDGFGCRGYDDTEGRCAPECC